MKNMKKLSAGLVMGLLMSVIMPQADARLIFSTSDEQGIDAFQYTLDQEDRSTTTIDLGFGSGLTHTLSFDTTTDVFSFTDALSLAGNELRNFIIENQASDPATCDGTTEGRMYYNTTSNSVLFCNGTSWTDTASGIADDSVTGAMLAPAVAGAGLVQDGSGNLDINVDDTTVEIATDTLQVKDGGITSAKIAADTITAGDIATGAVTTTEILDNTITATDIAADTITAAEIATGAVTTTEILDNTITATDIAANTITAAELATGSVGTDEIIDGTIGLDDIASREAPITFAPEYPNFTVEADGSNNVGTMESNHDAATDRNFYQWSTRRTATAQDYDIVFQWAVPENFQGFSTTLDEIMIDYKTDTTTAADNQLDVTLLDTAGATVTLTGGAALVSSVADTWVDDHGITFTGGTWTPGEYATLRIKMTSRATGPGNLNPAYVGAVTFNGLVK